MTRRWWWRAAAVSACLAGSAVPAAAQVTRLEVLSRAPMTAPAAGAAGPYEVIRGRIHGEVDPADRRNRIIQDLALAPRNARGRVEYVATFALAKPVDMARASGVLMYTVVNRGNGAPVASADGHVSLVSGWQGDLVPSDSLQTIAVPIARQRDGSAITGPMVVRLVNAPPGTTTLPLRLGSIGSGTPAYPPAGLDQPDARLISVGSETSTGEQRDVRTIPRAGWAFADCRTVAFPGTPDPTRLCVKDGFDPARLYQLSYRAQDPLVLGLGLAATRDIVTFFRRAAADAQGTANPVAGAIRHAVSIGDSQSGNFIRTFIHLGFNQGLDGRMVWDGAFPRIAARQTPINHRFAVPGGAAGLYEVGSDGVVWWGPYKDTRRKRARASLLDRCTATKTCPKVIEAFGSAEFWGLRMSPDLVGTDAARDIPLPANVRRYYYPGTTHGGGRGGFALESGAQPGCVLPANPNPETDTTRALTVALVDWVVRGTEPPPSRYPRLDRGELVAADAKAMGFPAIPGAPDPGPLVNPLLEYDYGRGLVLNDLTGALTVVPPRVVRALPTLVPRSGPDGNEKVDGVPSVLYQAPLGTYLGWNVTAGGFFKGQGCGFAGGYIPFARTRAAREQAGDPRPSLEERYGTLEGYVRVVQAAADAAVAERLLLRADGDRLIAEARASAILPPVPIDTVMNRCTSAIAAGLPSGAAVQEASWDGGRAICAVKATASSGPGSSIVFEVWIPAVWNGKLVVTGNGGYSNALNSADMAAALAQGYAAAGGDTGHQTATPDDLLWGVDAPERILDWGTRSIHTILEPARRIAEAAGGRAPTRSYFYGCSTGGHQGFAELQRYPDDFDGVIAGAPGHNRVRLNAAFLSRFLANHRPGDAEPILPASKLPLVTGAVIAACDANDGVRDGVVDDPRTCRFDPATLVCPAGDQPSCLTAPQLAALRRMYDGLRGASGAAIYPGWPVSSEASVTGADGRPQVGWHQYWGGAEPTRAAFWRRWVFRDPAWDWWTFDPDRDLAIADRAVGHAIDQTSDDLSAFAARGGKAIVYHGWQDPVVNPLDTIAYYERVRTRLGSQAAVDRAFRLFLVPGMGHCAGGPGATRFGNQGSPSPVVDADHDLLSALDAWVERGTAPDRVIASRVVDGKVVRTRPLCPYPLKAVYAGTGSTDEAASFTCR